MVAVTLLQTMNWWIGLHDDKHYIIIIIIIIIIIYV